MSWVGKYWTPCGDCEDKCCSLCLFTKYEKDIDELRVKLNSAEVRIENELEPRLKEEGRAYDFYVATDKSAELCEGFCFNIDELIDAVEENKGAFDWEDEHGDRYEQILYLIKQLILEGI